MRSLLTLLLICFGVSVFAQERDSRMLRIEVGEFDRALVNRDSITLARLLDNDLSYGHSNGWIQVKRDVIEDLFSGKLSYNTINSQPPDIKIEAGVASVRTSSQVEAVMGGKVLQLKLSVLQVWIWKNKHWSLFARQSCKI